LAATDGLVGLVDGAELDPPHADAVAATAPMMSPETIFRWVLESIRFTAVTLSVCGSAGPPRPGTMTR